MSQTSNGVTVRENIPLAPQTTLGVGGAARFFIEAETDEDIREAIAFAQERSLPLLPLGNGSNLLVPDHGVDAVVLKLADRSISAEETEGGFRIRASAGALWDDVVRTAGELGMFGIENLAAIPGSVGGAAVQNIGAYGGEFSRTFEQAKCIDLATGEAVTVGPDAAQFAYRTSLFKMRPGLFITEVALVLRKDEAPNLSYADLARAKDAGVPLATPREIASAVREIRARKFPVGQGTAGSFFKNPALPQAAADALSERFPGLPAFPQEDGSVKVSLAWLLDHALHLKGFAEGPVRLFENQPLVIVAGEGATGDGVNAFARMIAARVQDELGIAIEREVETFGAMRA